MEVTYDSNVNLGSNYLQVTVLDDGGDPIENAWVTAFMENEDFVQRAYTDEQGIVFLPMSAAILGLVDLTVTHHNNIPHLGTFNVISDPIFVNVNGVVIDDDNNGASSGNDDGLVNPGEDIELLVGLKNYGNQAANAVITTISSETEFITISDDSEDYGDILPGNTNYCNDSFKFSVDDNVLGGASIQINLDIEDNSGNQWDDHIFIPIAGANLDVADYTIIDANGILNPGDTVELIVTLFNSGLAEAINLQGELSCDNDYITFIDSIADFEDIQPGQTGDNDASRFELTADSHSINGSQIEFELVLSNTNGFYQTVIFLVDVGIVTVLDPLGPDNYGYYAYDSNDETYDLHPMYNWIEIDPAYSGSGTIITLYDNGDDGDVADVSMPFSFNFYGINYDMISVCSNGWIAPGGSSQASFMNSQIPGPQGPSPMIAPFWDDLKMSGGHVCYYYDLAEHAFIVEWSHLQSDWSNLEETFQVLIYDPAVYPTPSGDAEIVFQYQTINNNSIGNYSGYGVEHGQYSTVGLEDHDGTGGLEYTYNNTYPTAAAILQNEFAIKFTTMGGGAQSPPILNFDPSNIQFILEPETTGEQILQITNAGEANLIYSLEKTYDNSTDDSIEKTYINPVTETGRGHGGPDNFGYQWFDSYESNGPIYNWRDISSLGTVVTFVDPNQGTDLMQIGFDFYFYGTYYSEFRINPNGWIGFGDDVSEANNLSLPHPYAPKPAILPFWDDLDPISSGAVSYYSTSDSLVVWFDDVEHTAGNYNGVYDFQLILYTDGDMLIQYREMSGDTNSATIGIQNGQASDALQITYNGNFVENEFAVIIKKIADWMEIDPVYGFIEQGQSADITITANSSGLVNGEFLGAVVLTTNDPNFTVVEIPVSMLISLEFPQIQVSSTSIDFGSVIPGEVNTDTLYITNSGTVDLIISDITVTLPEFDVSETSFTLLAGDSHELYITFQPETMGSYDDILVIFSNDPIHPETEVDLMGVCEENSGLEDNLPLITSIDKNYPNPFNPETNINYSLAEAGNVSIVVYNIKGEKVRTLINTYQQPQNYNVVWNGKDENNKPVSSGVYFYKFEAGNIEEINKMLLLK